MVDRTASTSASVIGPMVERAAGIGEQDVEVPAGRRRLAHGRGDLLLDRHVGHDVAGGPHRAAGRRGVGRRLLERGDRGGQPVLGAAADGHVRPVAHQSGGRTEADTAAAAGHQRGVAGDARRGSGCVGHWLSPLVGRPGRSWPVSRRRGAGPCGRSGYRSGFRSSMLRTALRGNPGGSGAGRDRPGRSGHTGRTSTPRTEETTSDRATVQPRRPVRAGGRHRARPPGPGGGRRAPHLRRARRPGQPLRPPPRSTPGSAPAPTSGSWPATGPSGSRP